MQRVTGAASVSGISPRLRSWVYSSRYRLRSAGSSLVSLAEDDAHYYREVKDFRIEYNASAPGDFYELLGVDSDADRTTIRTAFREKQRLVHPDIAGDAAVDLSVLLNKAYEILMEPTMRAPYDKELTEFRSLHGVFDGKPISTWGGGDHEQRAIFVDETTCIGCRNCTGCAPSTFYMEDEWGRARVSTQWGDEEEWVKEAMDMCPVDCIYFVQKKQLALLEYVMKSCQREDCVILARRQPPIPTHPSMSPVSRRSGNMGTAPSKENPFTKAAEFMNKRAYSKMSAFEEQRAKLWLQDEELAAAIAKAWLQLPMKLRIKGWPSWETDPQTV